MEFWRDHLTFSLGKDFLAGGLGGIAGVIAGHPLDTIRIHLQQPQRPSASGPTTAGAVVRHLLATEGSSAFFKGMSSPLATVAIQNAVAFQAYALLSRALAVEKSEPLPLHRVAAAGIGAGSLQTLILTPVDLVKIRLQLHTAHGGGRSRPTINFDGPCDVARDIIKREGVRGLYRGFRVTVLRDAPSHGVYFAAYEYIREYLHPGCRKNGGETVMTMLTAGGCAGALSWIACYPLDVVKSRLQAQGQGRDSRGRYKGITDCISRSIREEGVSVLFRGLGTAIARAYLVNGAIFSAYEMTLRLFYSQPSQETMLENPTPM
ncbi:hypothetical protein O6H91_04G142600 [Diphasiastrum complanatum]|uniref:Uncharacterized protein n=2 Tax=Diphasiastrum complanatum TaxID=34168 RepID=A0ACC2E2M2_DIPCM|nr:hypothetical protein O6H91_04G142600 [Diphasiastrum complanatum]KAJ7560727.1 hypothetical protein O6H91_04G142600 [Diphasiastrum complanatum]